MNNTLPKRSQKRGIRRTGGSKKAPESPLEGEILEPPSENSGRIVLYSAPLPPPRMLREYDKISPGAAEIILGVYKENQAIRKEEQAIRKRDNILTLGIDFMRVSGSIIVSLAFIGAAVYLAYIGVLSTSIAAILAGAVVGVVRAFTSRIGAPKE